MSFHNEFVDHIPAAMRAALDIASIGVVVGTIANFLPQVAALLTIVWTGLRIANEVSVWRRRRRARPD